MSAGTEVRDRRGGASARASLAAAYAVAALVAGCAVDGTVPPECASGTYVETIPTDDGPEDMALMEAAAPHGPTRRLFVRVRNGIQTVALGPDGAYRGTVDPSSDASFDSLGLSLLRGRDGRPDELFAIDQGERGVRRYAVLDGRLEPRGATILGPAVLPWPNDLLAVPREGGAEPDLYVSNPDRFWKRLVRATWPSVVLLRAGENPKPVVTDLGFANGIAADEGGTRLLVADYRARRLVAYRRDPGDGGLERLCHVPLGAMPDNLSVDLGDPDRVLVAAQDSLPLSGLHVLVSARVPAPSRVLAVRFSELDLEGGGDSEAACRLKDPEPDKPWPRLVWADGGERVAAGSTAVQVGERLLVSQIVRPGVHSFRCPRTGAAAAGG